jgi:hypothetical protein
VKAPYNELLEELRARHQLRMAAIDRRLQVHQDSFVLWRELLDAVHSPNAGPSVVKCQTWWEANCLYLEPEVRKAFIQSYTAASLHPSLLANRADPADIKANWQEVMRFPEVLFSAVHLPPLSELERKTIEKEPPP